MLCRLGLVDQRLMQRPRLRLLPGKAGLGPLRLRPEHRLLPLPPLLHPRQLVRSVLQAPLDPPVQQARQVLPQPLAGSSSLLEEITT